MHIHLDRITSLLCNSYTFRLYLCSECCNRLRAYLRTSSLEHNFQNLFQDPVIPPARNLLPCWPHPALTPLNWDGSLHPAMTPLIHGMVHSIRLWHHLLMGWSTPSGSDATQSWDGLLHPALTPLNPGMVYSIRLWRHSILGWFTPFGSDATQSWDGLLYPALTPLNLGMVHSIRLWRHSIQGWFTPSGSDATQSWDMVYSIRFWHHSILGWFTPSGSDATQSWDDLHNPAFTPLTLDDSLHPSLTPRTNVYLGSLTPSGFDITHLIWLTPSGYNYGHPPGTCHRSI